jgi:hypothetical protein
MKTVAQERLANASPEKRGPWDQFRHDHELIERLKITPDEIAALENCALLGTLTCKQDLLFILRQIREATTTGAPPTVFAAPASASGAAYDSIDEPAPPDLSRIRVHLATPAAVSVESALHARVTKGRVREHFGVTFWVVILAAGLVWNFAIAISRWRDGFLAKVGTPANSAPAQTPALFARVDEFKMLIGWEILFMLGVSVVIGFLASRKRPRRLKVKPL